MGYYTNFTLRWEDTLPEPTIAVIVKKWREQTEGAQVAIDEDGSSEESAKWYDHEADVRRLSRMAEGTLFTLDCLGEDGERWRVVAKDGVSFRIVPKLSWPATSISPAE